MMADGLKIFYSTDVAGMWPVGFAAVMVAHDAEEAREILTRICHEHGGVGVPDVDCQIEELDLSAGVGKILCDGNY